MSLHELIRSALDNGAKTFDDLNGTEQKDLLSADILHVLGRSPREEAIKRINNLLETHAKAWGLLEGRVFWLDFRYDKGDETNRSYWLQASRFDTLADLYLHAETRPEVGKIIRTLVQHQPPPFWGVGFTFKELELYSDDGLCYLVDVRLDRDGNIEAVRNFPTIEWERRQAELEAMLLEQIRNAGD